MFRTLIYPSSGACDYAVELPHWSYCSWFNVCWSSGVVGLEWYPCCRLKRTKRTKNKTTNVVIQQHSRKLLTMDILMSETCWAHKKWNKIGSDMKLVFYSSTHFNITIYTYISQALSYIDLSWSEFFIQLLSRPCLLNILPICSYFFSRRDSNWWRFQPLYYNRRLHCSLRKY